MDETTSTSPAVVTVPGEMTELSSSDESSNAKDGDILSSSLAQSGGFFPQLDIPLSPIPKTPASTVEAVQVQTPMQEGKSLM